MLLRRVVIAGVFACGLLVALYHGGSIEESVALAATPTPYASASPAPVSTSVPGTNIYNQAEATYSDGTNSYTTYSNQVVNTIQDAPSLVITTNNGTSAGAWAVQPSATSQPIVAGDLITDTYQLTNTGNNGSNGSGVTFALASGALGTGTNVNASYGSFYQITVLCPGDSTAYATSTSDSLAQAITDANTHLSGSNCNNITGGTGGSTFGAYVIVGVTYRATTSSSGAQNLTSLAATISYPTIGGAPAATSTTAENNYDDTIVNDAQLYEYKSAANASGVQGITYTITAGIGGAASAQAVQSIGTGGTITGSALSKNGILIVDPIPLNSGTPYNVTSVTLATNASYLPSNDTAILVGTTDSTGKGSWSQISSGANAPSGTYYVGVYVYGTGSSFIPITNQSNNTASTSSGVGSPFATLSFTISTVSQGTDVLNDATGIFGDNQGCVEGSSLQAPSSGNSYTCGVTNNAAGNPAPAWSSPTTGSTTTGGNGYSNQSSWTTPGVLLGPYHAASAVGDVTGQTPTSTYNTNNYDFTEASVGLSSTYGSNVTSTACIGHTAQNVGPSSDNLTVNFPSVSAGTTVALYSDSACTTAITPTSGSGNTATWTFSGIASNATQDFYVKYSVTTEPAFTALLDQMRVTSSDNGSYTNDTYDDLFPGGFIELQKSSTVATTNCPGSANAGGVCPGGTIVYTVTYKNVLPSLSSVTPSGASGNALLALGTGAPFQITENGTGGSNTWGTYGTLQEAINVGISGTNQAKCGVGSDTADCGDSNQYSTLVSGGTVGATAFVINIGTQASSSPYYGTGNNTALAPQSTGTIVFAVKVK